ncbi:hypothetical protein PTTG_06689 [Puccinia triticina 1-1 BBBD Race 1]|uniref:Uncharacterized protein n=1 Tax=Puccinia triticina (isolate 1-1 / race 1 (BBBD)) TaxID=630390 RepID=A0A180GU38_PUCT1|nr:hypothetical protein PTTG_06689 [Puccinia triticina 1-1 BBBD Race 1]
MAETSQQNSPSATASLPPQKNGFEELELALPPLQEDFLKLPEEEPLPPDTGIPPALYHLRETSIALASNRSTPVPRPIEREQLDTVESYPQTSQRPSQPTNPEGMRPTGGAEHVNYEAPPLPSFYDPRDDNRTCWEEQQYPSLSRMDTQRRATQPGSFLDDSEQRHRTAELYGAYDPASFATSHSAVRHSAAYSSHTNTRTYRLSTTNYGAGVPGSYPLQKSIVLPTAANTAAPREPDIPPSSNAAATTAADAPSEAATRFYTARGGSVVPPQPASSNWRVQSTPLSSHAARICIPQSPLSSRQLERIREELETPTGQHSDTREKK